MAHDPQAFDPPYPLAMTRFPELRQSLLSSFDNCALTSAYDVEYRKGWSTEPQSRGQIAHQVFAACLRQMAELREEQIPVDAALGILRDIIRQDHIDRVCPKCGTEEILPGLYKNGTKRCANGHLFESEFVNLPMSAVKDLHWVTVKWATDNSFSIADLVDVELTLRATLAYPNRLHGGSVPRKLKGTLDTFFLEGTDHAIVVDWKDTWAVPAAHDEGQNDEISFGGFFQQRFYAWLIFASFPNIQKVTLREFYVRYSQTREASLTRQAVPEIEAELEALTERFDRVQNEWLEMDANERRRRIANGKLPFQPTPGKHCGFCTRPDACPVPGYARDEGKISSESEAIRAAKKVLVAEKVLKVERSALRAWADTHGPVPIKDAKGKRAFGYVMSTRTTRPSLDDLERAILENEGKLTPEQMKGLYVTVDKPVFKAHVPEEVDESQLEAEIQQQLEASIAAAQKAQEKHGPPKLTVLKGGAAGPETLEVDEPAPTPQDSPHIA